MKSILVKVEKKINQKDVKATLGEYFSNNGFLPTDPEYVAFSGMPFYDAWAQAQFLADYGRAMTTFTTNTVDPTAYPDEVAFLQAALGNFTASIMTYVRATQPSCRFEVLYPTDVNATAFNSAFNFPVSAWTPSALTILKTECFGYTLGRNLNLAEASIDFGASLGFAASQRSHLVGVGDSTTAWLKEARSRAGQGTGERGAVRAGSVLPDRIRDAAAAELAAKHPDGQLIHSGSAPALSMLQVQNVSKVYRLYRAAGRPAAGTSSVLSNMPRRRNSGRCAMCRLTVERGEVLGVIGPNGSGKSTLLQIVSGILEPTRGRVLAQGRIAALLELGAGFNPEFTGRENVFLNGEILGIARREMERVFPEIETIRRNRRVHGSAGEGIFERHVRAAGVLDGDSRRSGDPDRG